MKKYISYLTPILLILSCDFEISGPDFGSNWDWDLPEREYIYQRKVIVLDVNSDTCFNAMVVLKDDTTRFYADPEFFGIISVTYKDSVENNPDEFAIPAGIWINGYDPTKFKFVDIILLRGGYTRRQIIQFDIPQ